MVGPPKGDQRVRPGAAGCGHIEHILPVYFARDTNVAAIDPPFCLGVDVGLARLLTAAVGEGFVSRPDALQTLGERD